MPTPCSLEGGLQSPTPLSLPCKLGPLVVFLVDTRDTSTWLPPINSLPPAQMTWSPYAKFVSASDALLIYHRKPHYSAHMMKVMDAGIGLRAWLSGIGMLE